MALRFADADDDDDDAGAATFNDAELQDKARDDASTTLKSQAAAGHGVPAAEATRTSGPSLALALTSAAESASTLASRPLNDADW